jgi:hypothetical protein
VTFLLPGGLGQLGAQSALAWDPTTTGWSSATPPMRAATIPELAPGAPGMPGGRSIAPLLAPTSITDTFPTVENPLSSGGQWMHQTAYWNKLAVLNFPPHICYGLQTGAGTPIYDDSYAYLSPLVWPPSHTDYSVAITIDIAPDSGGDADEFECLLRVNDSPLPSVNTGGVLGGTATLYECNYQLFGAYQQIVTWGGPPGSFNSLAAVGPITAISTGDVLLAQIQGNNITVKRNGTTVNSYNDTTATYPTGQPGFGKYYQGSGGGNHMGYTQVVVTSLPYTAPTPSNFSASVSSLASAGTIVGQIPCQHNPTSWSITSASPSVGSSYFSIDSFANIVVQAAGVGNLVAPTYTLTVQATNSFGSNTATVTITNVGVTGPIFSNNNHSMIDGDGSHGEPLAVRGTKAVLSSGTAASRRRYFEMRNANVGETPSTSTFVSAGAVLAAWNAATVSNLPLGTELAGTSAGLISYAPGGDVPGQYFVFTEQKALYAAGTIAPVAGDIIGVAIDTSGVNFPGETAIWFNVNGNWVNQGAPTTTFPGLATPDTVLAGTQAWPAGSTDYTNHITIKPNTTPLYTPPGFTPL